MSAISEQQFCPYDLIDEPEASDALSFEDWLFHALLPPAAYMILELSALMVGSYPRESLFGVATSAVSLLFIGIHNAWDMVTYHVLGETDQETGKIERADTNTEKTKNGKQRKHK